VRLAVADDGLEGCHPLGEAVESSQQALGLPGVGLEKRAGWLRERAAVPGVAELI